MPVDYQAIFSDLPEDPYAGSFELLKRVEAKVLPGSPREAEYSAACGIFEAFYEANAWTSPKAVNVSRGLAESSETTDRAIQRVRDGWRLQYEAYRDQIIANHQHAIKAAAADSLSAISKAAIGYAILDSEEKNEIQVHLEKVRKIIEESNLDDRKKNSLFERLSELVKEVNRNGTRTDRFFAFASELGFSAGQFAKNSKPLFDEVTTLLKIITRARSRSEGISLPPGGEVLLLPQPNSESQSK
jgi:hypothetical protein